MSKKCTDECRYINEIFFCAAFPGSCFYVDTLKSLYLSRYTQVDMNVFDNAATISNPTILTIILILTET